MRYILAIAIGLALTLGLGSLAASYSGSADFSGWVPKQELAAAEHVTDLIRTRKFDQVDAALDPGFRWGSPDTVGQMADFFEKDVPFKARVTGWQTRWQKSLSGQAEATGQAIIQIRYSYPDGRAVQTTYLFQRDNGKETITGINFLPLTAARSRMGELDLTAMTGPQSVILFFAVLIDTFAFATCAICLMGPQPRWRTRWLWALLSLVGVLRLNAVWTTGQLFFIPESVLFPPVGMTQIPVGTSWIYGFSIPLGAILYWVFRYRRGWGEPAVAAADDLRV